MLVVLARQYKNRNPKLFNKIINLAEEGKTSVGKIGTDPEVIKLNNGRKIGYSMLLKILLSVKKEKNFLTK